jgi:hypothetical protein
MWAASGLESIILPGVNVAALEAPFIPMFPEPVWGVVDPIIFPEIAVGEDLWAEQADKISAMETIDNNKNVFIYLASSKEKPIYKYIRHYRL